MAGDGGSTPLGRPMDERDRKVWDACVAHDDAKLIELDIEWVQVKDILTGTITYQKIVSDKEVVTIEGRVREYRE